MNAVASGVPSDFPRAPSESDGSGKPPTTRPNRRAFTKRFLDALLDGTIDSLVALSKLHPVTHPASHGVSVERNVSYVEGGDGAHRLDVYLPAPASRASGSVPAVLYVHGGGFQRLSKETLGFAALTFARRGYAVFNVDYRLAPAHRYPAAVADVCAAAIWVRRNARRYGADPNLLFLAGESAGANLVTALAVATAYRRPEPWARAVWDEGVRARAVMAACGLLQVSHPERFAAYGVGRWVLDSIREIHEAYVCPFGSRDSHALADPLVALEQGGTPERPLPAFIAPIGELDPLRHDTRRLAIAMRALGVECSTPIYAGGVHGFHVLMPWQARSRDLWEDTLAFFARHVSPDSKHGSNSA